MLQKVVVVNGKPMPADQFLEELEIYKKNNLIKIKIRKNGKEKEIDTLCDACFKAHAIQTAKKLGLDNTILISHIGYLDAPMGHDGYYMNGEELIKI